MHPDELLDRYTIPQLVELRAYDLIEQHLDPWLQSSIICSRLIPGTKANEHRPRNPFKKVNNNDGWITLLKGAEAAYKRRKAGRQQD